MSQAQSATEWFDQPDPTDAEGRPGLAFECTMCGCCCSGPEGYVLVSDLEAAALAQRLSLSTEAFLASYTRETSAGRSLTEKTSGAGLDCVFLDRTTIPGKAICGVYEDRPAQCRTWPFWRSTLGSRSAWERAKAICPGMDKGTRFTPLEIRARRAVIPI